MTQRYFDIAIIGGGVIGLAIARALARTRLNIVVIDAGADLPGATAAAAGMLAPSFEHSGGPGAEALYDFSAASLSLWPEFARALEAETGLSVDYRDDGILGVALDGEQAAALQRDSDALTARGAAVEWLGARAALELEPCLSARVAGAVYAKGDAQVDPRKLVAALRKSLHASAALIDDVVVAAKKNGPTFRLTLRFGAQLEADKIVLASGAAANAIVADLPPPPVTPAKGEALAMQMSNAVFRHVIRAPGAYLCPKAGGRLVIGASEYEARDDLDVDDIAIAKMIANGAKAVPAISDFVELERWAGLRPATPDGAPILGCDSRGPENVFLALGAYRNGILLAPAIAEALARLILGNEADASLDTFRPERFGP